MVSSFFLSKPYASAYSIVWSLANTVRVNYVVEQAIKDQEERALVRRAFLVKQMENPMFREWLMDQLMFLGTFLAPVALTPTGVPDPYSTYFALGQQQAGWKIYTDVDAVAPELASLMRRERFTPPDVETVKEILKGKPRRRRTAKVADE